VICGLARTSKQDIEAAWNAVRTPSARGSTRSSRRATSTSSASCRRRARTSRARPARPSRRRANTPRTSSSRRGRLALGHRVHGRGDPGRARRGRDDDQRARHRRLHDAARVRAMFEELYRLVPDLRDVTVSVHCHDDLGLAVANSLAGVEAGCRQVECAINGIGERAGNASLEEIVMLLRTRASRAWGCGRASRRRDRAHQPAGVAPDRLSGAAEQGDRRAQRVRARGGHPPGRRAEGAHDLRDHGRDHGRAAQPTRSCWASTRAATR
jgi:hypothetical protein